MPAALDFPVVGESVDPLSIRVQGWVHGGPRHEELVAVEAVTGNGTRIGRTELLYPRPDVSAELRLDPQARTGFTMLCAAPELTGETSAQLQVIACFADGTREAVADRALTLSGRDYRKGDWGILIDPAFPHLVRREHMYNSGPSLDAPSPELLTLLERYLPPVAPAAGSPERATVRVLDVGCGRGPYAEPLRACGYDWFGAEIKEEDCAVLTRKGLPHYKVDGQSLPFDSGAFEAGLCIEVLEHTANPWEFIAEVRRVIRRRLIVSVPNLEVVPYWRPHLAVPWHLLEADHKNFFSRASLRELLAKHFRAVEVIAYGQAPLRSAEGAALDYHLLAIADV